MEELRFTLPVFEGPLDLLFHLISKNKIDIFDIPISSLLDQYLDYIRQMEQADLALTSDFTAMASKLLYIKSRMLLPADKEEEDPRSALVRDLLEYQRYKSAAKYLEGLMRLHSGTYTREGDIIVPDKTYRRSHDPLELVSEYCDVAQRARRRMPPPVRAFSGIVGREPVPIIRGAFIVLRSLLRRGAVTLQSLCSAARDKSEIIAIFLSVLILAKSGRIKLGDGEIPTISVGKGPVQRVSDDFS